MRLIDADCLNFEGQHYNKSQMKAILDFVDAQPTALDIDKVVSELEKATQYIKIDGKPTSVKAIHPEQAIEIVKRGGVSDVQQDSAVNCSCMYIDRSRV